ncbi:MAG: hypothetical protein WD069_17900 [Planctomycetales bacterium]
MNRRTLAPLLLVLPLACGCATEPDDPRRGPGMSRETQRGGEGGVTPPAGPNIPGQGQTDRPPTNP